MKVWGVGDGGNAETWPDFRLITHFLGDLGKVTSLSGSQFFFSTIKWKEQSLPYPLHRTIKWLGTCFINHTGSMNVRRVTSLLNPTCVTPSARSLSLSKDILLIELVQFRGKKWYFVDFVAIFSPCNWTLSSLEAENLLQPLSHIYSSS